MINLSDLPYEIILYILDYLDTCDKIAFLTVFPEFSNKDSVLLFRNVNLGRQFRRSLNFSNICKDLGKMIDLSYIKVFIINSLYWIPEKNLLKCISKMTNLHTLLALDTKLELIESHCAIYKRLPLEKVALTLDLERDQIAVFTALPNVKKLCLKYGLYDGYKQREDTVAMLLLVYTSVRECQNLEELVLIEEDEDCHADGNMYYYEPDLFEFLHVSLKCRRFIYKKKPCIDFIPRNLYDSMKRQGFRTVYNNVREKCRDGDGDMISCVSYIECEYCTNTYEELIFYKSEENNFDQLNLDAKSLSNLEDIFKVFPIKDNDNGGLIVRCLQQAPSFDGNIEISDILKTLPNLYKLEVASCFLIHLDGIDGIESYFKNLQEFQVISCPCGRSIDANTVPKLEVISKFGNLLRKLSIENYVCEDSTRNSASILANILKNCQNLESLQIILLHKNEDITRDTNMVLINNLKHARRLKEFGFYVKLNIIIDPLIETLKNMEAKLERVYLKAHEVTGVQDKDDIIRKINHYIINNHELFLLVVDLFKNQYGIKSFENKSYISCPLSNDCYLPDYVRSAHVDFVVYRFNTGFNPFVNF